MIELAVNNQSNFQSQILEGEYQNKISTNKSDFEAAANEFQMLASYGST